MKIYVAKNEKEKQKAFDLRIEVFVNEQNVLPEIELDAEDARATHIIAEDGDTVIGCARILFGENDAHIGRFAIKKPYRGMGLGTQVFKFILEHCRSEGYDNIWFNAQTHAVTFYERLGFVTVGEPFYEAGIEHIKMIAK